ncbi:hypothetical protein AVEN_22049-1 [Araneus ventricosus]|uniref:Uncharacterized protein n=1 Tax=Araneus ventricosus TaxID=182803 RepID=A0A4Y2VVY4_ARAVE|nr:hypothetical protein AVEN_22049-1 [Araneus ventricosus]
MPAPSGRLVLHALWLMNRFQKLSSQVKIRLVSGLLMVTPLSLFSKTGLSWCQRYVAYRLRQTMLRCGANRGNGGWKFAENHRKSRQSMPHQQTVQKQRRHGTVKMCNSKLGLGYLKEREISWKERRKS